MKGKTKSSPEATLVIVNNSPESSPAKSPSVRNNKGASASALNSTSSPNDGTSSSSPAVTPPLNPHADVVESQENERSESASTVQIASQNVSGGAQPSTPRTPNTPSDHGASTPNPPTPGNTAIVTCPSPSYVTISGEETSATSSRSYTSLTPVNSTGGVDVDHGEDNIGGSNSTYVTYVEGSADHSSLYAAAAAATANGQTMSYPVYTVGETGAMYAGTNQYYTTTSATNSGITYAQEAGVTYLVPSTNNNNNNNSNNTANANLENDGQPNISHATRVSPATNENKRRRSSFPRPDFEDAVEWADDDENLFDDDDDVGTLGFMGDDIEDHVIMLCSQDIPRVGEGRGTQIPSDNFLATLKSCPITVQWLLENYETAEGVSLPRSTLYYHYLRHCTEHKLDPVNAASFGKLIRSVFLGLRTRRLGTRGNSKYHYYGIRLKPESPLNGIDDSLFEEQALAAYNRSHSNGLSHNNSNSSPRSMVGIHTSNHSAPSIKRAKTSKSLDHVDAMNGGLTQTETLSIQHYLGDTSQALENLPELDLSAPVPDGLLQDDLLVFRTLYREHCSELLADVVHFQLSEFQKRWKLFWRTSSDGPQTNGIEHCEYDNVLPKTKLHALCTMREVQNYIRRTDYQFYQNIVVILLPDVLRPIPASMTQAIRNFAKGVEGCLTSAMTGYPEEVVAVKLSVVSAFSQTLRRYTSLNHLAQAARAVLQNQNQITQMLSDLNRVDFHNVEEQASWVCGCNEEIVPELEADFKATLGQQQSLEEWASWLEGVVDRVLTPHANTPKYATVARTFLLKWSFYSSLVIRDLTLRSAASFGSFHLLRLLYDEYMFYLIENRVAQMTGVVPISVIGKKTNNRLSFEPSRNNIEADMSESQNHGLIKI